MMAPSKWAVSSAVEHYLDTVGAVGSIPIPPTILFFIKDLVISDGSFLWFCYRGVLQSGSLPIPTKSKWLLLFPYRCSGVPLPDPRAERTSLFPQNQRPFRSQSA